MSEVARQYELVYIVNPDASEERLAALHGEVESIVSRFSGTLGPTENWGRRKLAYEIARHREGVYVIEALTGPGSMMRELDRRLRVVDDILRHLVIRIDDELQVAERAKARREAAAAKKQARQARRRATQTPEAGEGDAAGTPGAAANETPAGEVGEARNTGEAQS